jgi:predicted DNA-binding transcriptional regulator AlpA
MSPNEYVNVRALAEITGISVSTWNKRRLTGDTPPFTKVGRSVRYHVPTVKQWLAAHQRRSTSDAAPEAA